MSRVILRTQMIRKELESTVTTREAQAVASPNYSGENRSAPMNLEQEQDWADEQTLIDEPYEPDTPRTVVRCFALPAPREDETTDVEPVSANAGTQTPVLIPTRIGVTPTPLLPRTPLPEPLAVRTKVGTAPPPTYQTAPPPTYLTPPPPAYQTPPPLHQTLQYPSVSWRAAQQNESIAWTTPHKPDRATSSPAPARRQQKSRMRWGLMLGVVSGLTIVLVAAIYTLDDEGPQLSSPTRAEVTEEIGVAEAAVPRIAVPQIIVAPDVAPADVAPTDVAPTDVAPTDVAPTDVAPTDVAPTDVAPTDVAPTDVAPADVAPATEIAVPAASTSAEMTGEVPEGREVAERYYNAGMSELMKNEPDSARQSFLAAMRADPQYDAPVRSMGFVYQLLGDDERAKRWLRRYLKRAPDASDVAAIRRRINRLSRRP